MVEIKTDLRAVSELIGAYNNRAIHALCAMSQSGKTTLTLQLLYEFSHKTGKNVLLYDTEGGADEFVAQWDKVFREHYPNAKKVLVRVCRNWKDILLDHGRRAIVKVSDNGKYGVTVVPNQIMKDKAVVDKFPMMDFVEENNIGMIVYDSFTMPFKDFGASQENFPARNSAQSALTSSMFDLIDRKQVILWTNHHVSKNPADQYAVEQMTGGSALQYACKVIVYMKKFDAKGAKHYRQLQILRMFKIDSEEDKIATGKLPKTFCKLTNNGYVDADELMMEESKKAAKQG